MKKIIFGLMLSTSTAFASDVSINFFSIVRSGGGQMEAIIFQQNNTVYAYALKCKFQEISKEKQSTGMFALKGTEANDALNILNNNAIIASDESIRDPNLVTGTWLATNFEYKYKDPNGVEKTESKSIKKPIFIINSRVSNVLEKIEQQIRQNYKGICD
ncbi:hypothetical protein [Fluviispira multicolorata]|uniref:Uncharacterized protein n=1 Tax=Fluviispira multicolorata TaxID=2654512 RepID=A0A833N7A5_9BACT|nr:hypothetical protein [Fluviispira multicolorata]KAB8031975.1 hypothetical protein GCL57_04835 [Fluviispira multicolorata]